MNLQLEKQIENEFVAYASKHNAKVVKFIDQAMTGAPDRIVLCPGGKIFFIEFKKPGGTISLKQDLYHRVLHSLGFYVYTCYSFQQAKEVFDYYVSN